jgi:hypothetical protein
VICQEGMPQVGDKSAALLQKKVCGDDIPSAELRAREGGGLDISEVSIRGEMLFHAFFGVASLA